MKDKPAFWQGDAATPPPPSADPLRLIQFALSSGRPIQVVNFAGAVKSIEYSRKVPASGTCFHRPSGEWNPMSVVDCQCGATHPLTEICTACGEAVPYHNFPGREPRVAVITVQAPVTVGENLQRPPGEQDGFVLIHIPREAIDAMDSPIVAPSLILRPH